jgi:predicted nicotinamide N-methyase
VSAVLLAVGASRVVATDLPENLELLRGNVRAAAAACGAAEEEDGTSTAAEEEDGTSTAAPTTPTFAVKALRWGEDAASALGETFDVVVAADCMYVEETAGELADATRALAPAAVFSYGRNRQAEDAFADACGGGSRALAMEDVPEDELDELYQCSDVRVVRLRLRAKKA